MTLADLIAEYGDRWVIRDEPHTSATRRRPLTAEECKDYSMTLFAPDLAALGQRLQREDLP
ncbi:hypothetical protein [Nonomuraea soli]|uniref:Uncharacterized protein n=1 Tax=Nonomuraea soli TaxID=1032476 RepID=A0A7W0HVT8_9ACTN|nr:hypothetical protein [Nonomuraea soli]MBA2897412.1 hypothetical protein [Nonomuraea soli]